MRVNPVAWPLRRIAAALTVSALLAACGNSSAPEAGAARGRPNIVVILADDLGYSDLGAFGSEIRTPNIDALARDGQVLTNFHVTQLCSTTRANLLTGADHHLVGIGSLVDLVLPYQTDQPGYEGQFNHRARTIAQLLRDGGYHTYMAGKWHLGEPGPERWGFERSFALAGTLGNANNFGSQAGLENSADPVFFENGEPATLAPGKFTADHYADKLIEYVDEQRGDRKPFFLYYAVQTPHWPIQAPDQYLDRYSGVYDAGYGAIREARIGRQKALGIIPADFKVHPGTPIGTPSYGIPGPLLHRPWGLLTPLERRQEARSMEVFAGMLENLDDNVGRLLRHLKDIGQYDNTLVVFLSDNGADGNGYPIPPSGYLDNSLENYGRQGSFIYHSVGWADAGAAPFRMFKGFTAEGGISSPTLVKLPHATGASRKLPALASVLDLAPTILELAGMGNPGTQYHGREVAPLEGRSLLPLLRGETAAAHAADAVFAGEVYNHRYVRRGPWKITRADALPFAGGLLANQDWQLYNVDQDRGETTLLATRSVSTLALPAPTDEYSEIFDGLLADWRAYVERVGVALPDLQQ
ncbi:arylsulfatase [Solimonas sp. K1W22B-7]|uniref:arylsulfatase n=1 Tax=Solimonas sp. K1W22B-7 TaxID=2303331 RepID=UPI000E33387D|nr:arylsulfatase [Solimonas sp. K1W22B-7]AXQ27601.1 arylsulfatase [Solimonas sp. K1W22B-7]